MEDGDDDNDDVFAFNMVIFLYLHKIFCGHRSLVFMFLPYEPNYFLDFQVYVTKMIMEIDKIANTRFPSVADSRLT